MAVPTVVVAQSQPPVPPPPIIGTDGADVLQGGQVGERIDGRGGADRIEGAGGADVITCGAGADVVVAERQDIVSNDCETVTYRRSASDDVADSPLDAHQQHLPPVGHLPGSSENVELVGRVDIEGAAEGRVADVAAYGNFAYLTVRDPEGCSEAGVAVIDISDPTSPVQVGFIDATEGSFPGEGAQVVDLRTRSFRGQVLVFNNELCTEDGEGGVSLWDVTDPTNPQVLTAHTGDDNPGGAFSQYNQIHSAFAWQQGRRAFVVIVDNEEFTDVDILEITDPTNPQLLVEMDLADLFDIEQPELASSGNFQSVNLHDMVVQKIQGTWTMLLSYWDGGWVLLDVDDPANPTYISDSNYPYPDTLFPEFEFPEGNAHQAEFSPNGRYIIGTDEDFSPYRTTDFEITSGPNAGVYESSLVGGGASPAILDDLTLNGPVVYGGYGCPDSAPLPTPESIPGYQESLQPGEESILVLQRGPSGDPGAPEESCFPGEKAHQAVLAGWDAVVLANRHVDPDAAFCGSGAFVDEIVAACTTHEAFHLMFNTPVTFTYPEPPVIGAVGERISVGSVFDGWGYVRLLDRKTMEQIDAYAIAEALDPDFAQGFGDLSVHEVAVDPRRSDLAYLSYYSGGLRVIRYGKDGIEEVGHYIDGNGNNFWGVEVHRLRGGRWSGETLILASDRDSGLWIFRYTGD